METNEEGRQSPMISINFPYHMARSQKESDQVPPTSYTAKQRNEGENHKTTTSTKLLPGLALVP